MSANEYGWVDSLTGKMLSIILLVSLVAILAAFWIVGLVAGIVLVVVLAVAAGVAGQYVGTTPADITRRSFAVLYIKTIFKDIFPALGRTVRSAFIFIGLWLFISFSLFISLTVMELRRAGSEPTMAEVLGWTNDTVRVAVVILVIIVLYQLRQILSSVLTLLAGLDGKKETTVALGAREPTRSELDNIISSLEEIHARTGREITAPEDWMVLDAPIPNHYVIGKTAYLTTALIDGKHRTVGMVHALGHIQHGDGVILLALRRLIKILPYYYGVDRRILPPGPVAGGQISGGAQVITRASNIELSDRMRAVEYAEEFTNKYGGKGLLYHGQHWAAFWRERVYFADEFVYQMGYSVELIEYLDEFQIFDVAQPFLARGRPYICLAPMSRPRNDGNKIERTATTTWFFRQNGPRLVCDTLGSGGVAPGCRSENRQLIRHRVQEPWHSL